MLLSNARYDLLYARSLLLRAMSSVIHPLLILRLGIPELFPRPVSYFQLLIPRPSTQSLEFRNHIENKQDSRREFPQFVPHHCLRNQHIIIDLPVVNLEFQSHEIR